MSVPESTFTRSRRFSAKSWSLLARRLLVTLVGLTLFASVTVAGSQEPASAQAELDTTMLLFDLSGSMGQIEPDGRTRLAVAQQSMIQAIGGIAPGSRNIGVRSFSNCGVTTLEQAPAPADQASLAATINSFSPVALTDIAVALNAVAGDFAASSGRSTVILLSDGAHNCAGDPCQTANDLIAAGIDIVVHAIGIGTAGTSAETQLSCIANVTGGTVVSVDGADELFDAIDDAFDGNGATAASVDFQIPTCINSAMVQNDPALAALSLGVPYRDSAGTSRILISGQECNFDCADGFDINCDGKIGDFCDSSFDLDTVHGVGQCLAQLGLDDDGESIAEIAMLENHCVESSTPFFLNQPAPSELSEACRHYRNAKTLQARADDAASNGDASFANYNQVLADDAFSKAQAIVDALCAAGPSDSVTQSASGSDWAMNYRISADDGLVLTNIFLGQRKMAEQVSIPYLSVKTADGSEVRVELIDNILLGDCPDANSRSQVVQRSVTSDGLAPQIVATYRIDQIDGLAGALTVTQRYEFDAELPEGHCEPSAFAPAPIPVDDRKFPCSPFRLTVEYDYVGPDAFRSIEIPQRMHFKVEDRSNNAATALLDNNSIFEVFRSFGSPIGATLPFTFETIAPGLENGQVPPNTPFDNFHQTFLREVSEPTAIPAAPGCPECVHMHWRWSNQVSTPGYFGPGGPGSPLIPAGSPQSLNIGISRFRAGELDPVSYHDVINGQPVGIAGGDPVLWYISSSTAASDTFFGHQGVGGAFFSIGYVDLSVAVEIPTAVIGRVESAPVTVTARNAGPGDAGNVVAVVRVIDGDVDADSLPSSCEPQLAGSEIDIICSVGDIVANGSRSFQFHARNALGGPMATAVRVDVISDHVEFDESNNAAGGVFTSGNDIDVGLTGSVTEDGDELRYELTVENSSLAESVSGVVLTVRLPDSVDPTTVRVQPDDVCSVNSQAVVTCEFSSIQLFSRETVTISAPTRDQSGETVVASVTAANPDPDDSNNRIEISIN